MPESKKILIFDLEIKNAILGRGEQKRDDVQYCGGWEDHAGMGVAVLCAWVGWKQWPMVFFEENLHEFADLAFEADLCAGFNNIGFDNKVLYANGIKVPDEKSYDILREIQIATGKRAKLDDCCSVNFGIGKSGDGGMAPILWQQGKRLEVINYCMHDTVAMTRRLLETIWLRGEIKHPYQQGQMLKLRKPFETDLEFSARRTK
jgi:hypothetical protein